MRPVTASERRGILIIAGLALAVTGAGIIVARCDRQPVSPGPQDAEVVFRPLSPAASPGVEDSAGSPRARKAAKAKKEKPKKAPKVYRRRNPRDETVE